MSFTTGILDFGGGWFIATNAFLVQNRAAGTALKGQTFCLDTRRQSSLSTGTNLGAPESTLGGIVSVSDVTSDLFVVVLEDIPVGGVGRVASQGIFQAFVTGAQTIGAGIGPIAGGQAQGTTTNKRTTRLLEANASGTNLRLVAFDGITGFR